MPLSGTLMRHATYPRRIAWSSAIIGIVFFVLFVSLVVMLAWHKRARQHEELVSYSQHDLHQALDTLIKTLNPLLQFTQFDCDSIGRELTTRAAFAGNVRSILLVRDGNAYCSSITGAFSLPVNAFASEIDLDRDKDFRLLNGTPLQPGKPAVSLWLKAAGEAQTGVLAAMNLTLTPYQLLASYHPEISGMAIVAQDYAITSWRSGLVSARDLPAAALARAALPDYPVQFVLYGSVLTARDYSGIALSGFLFALLTSCGCWLVLTLWLRPGKEIMQGIRRGEFHVEYQPLIATLTNQPYGLEALLRWNHPTKGTISPDAFISYAEAQNLIIPLTRHLFQLVVRDAHRLCQHLPQGTRMGLNLSPLHLASDEFRRDVMQWINAMPAGHFNYIFEITERTMVREKNAGEIFAWLHKHEIKIAIDDFGTGHSALIYLEKYPFDYLKIDRGFVQSIGTETVTSPVLDAVLHLAKKLNLKTVAEGVETGDQASWLVSRGVTHLQGYLFSRPLKPEKLIDYYRQLSVPL
ncbi:cyclic di-GMP phosphodiesterase [Pantoea sp.]|uniref:cyclic di-GMP phosphodiesterase n=1 Tax=Pantoea sp. TaxID=69393 RepID=UPI00289DEBDA|nr:cyclic di-GMP phosphodiesterase [Pantoea sp.]